MRWFPRAFGFERNFGRLLVRMLDELLV